MKNIIIHVPHSSTYIPPKYRETALISQQELDEENRFMCDTGVIDLIPPALLPNTLRFPYSRLYCDVERLRDGNEPMEAYGMGYIYTRDSLGRDMFSPDEKHIEEVNAVYDEYHKNFDKRVKEILNEYGKCIIIDLHSFSDETVDRLFGCKNCPDVCIGTEEDYYSEELVDFLKCACEKLGLSVMINYPYKGSIVPNAYYGKKDTGIVSVMIEINKRIL